MEEEEGKKGENLSAKLNGRISEIDRAIREFKRLKRSEIGFGSSYRSANAVRKCGQGAQEPASKGSFKEKASEAR